jgi:hypothetical protein
VEFDVMPRSGVRTALLLSALLLFAVCSRGAHGESAPEPSTSPQTAKAGHHGAFAKTRGAARHAAGSGLGGKGGARQQQQLLRRSVSRAPLNRRATNHTRSLARAARVQARHEAVALSFKNSSRKARKVVRPLNASLVDPPMGPPSPPCPAAAKASSKMRYKLASRQYKCSQPGVHPPSEHDAVPLIWSRDLVSHQRVFRNENPFETTKFRPFLGQLPPTSNATHFLRSGLCSGPENAGRGSLACDTCAVVGASGSLLARRHGALIDAHQVVVRPNWLLTKGFEHIVGTRTDLNLFFGVEGMIDQFDTAQRKLPRERRAVGLVTSASDRSIASFFRHMSRVHKKYGANRTRPDETHSSIYLLSDALFHRALGALCAATNGGCDWQRSTSRMRPSTGFFSVVLALQLCRKVSLFGLTTDPCQPFHYYGEPKKECTAAIPPKYDETVHWFEKEHEIYDELQKKGRVTLYS